MVSRSVSILKAGFLYLMVVLAACGSKPETAYLRAYRFAESAAASRAEVSLSLLFMSETPLRGVYLRPAAGEVRYSLANDTFRIDLQQTGRDVWFLMAGGAIHLTPDELTDTEYDRLRKVLGPIGVPLLSLSDFLTVIGREYRLIGSRQEGMRGDDILTAAPSPDYRAALRSWVAIQTGADGHVLNLISPDTLSIRIDSRSGAVKEIKQQNGAGEPVSLMTFSYPKSIPTPPPLEPPHGVIFEGRDLMMALGAGPDWLVGKPVPEGLLVSLDGRVSSLSDFKGRPMIVNFWASWCGPCRIEWPVLQQMYEKHGKSISFILLATEDKPLAQSYIASNGYTAPVYLLPDNKIRIGFGVTALPATFFVDAAGLVQRSFTGIPPLQTIGASQAALREIYETILSEIISQPKRNKGL